MVISVIAIIAMFFVNPIPQDQLYHSFADKNTFFSVPNFWNVISNLPFVFIGVLGLFKTFYLSKNYELKNSYVCFFIGIFLTGFGSGYYHYQPNDATLIWDRIPMTITFMSFLSIIVGEFINIKSGEKSLISLISVGLFSISYWVLFKDLRPYALVQFLPIILILLILLFSEKNKEFKKYFYFIVIFYFIAKVLENKDDFIYSITSEHISGHSLKHLFASAAPFVFYKYFLSKNNLINKL